MRAYVLLISLLFLTEVSAQELTIVPLPNNIELSSNTLKLSADVGLKFDEGAENSALFLKERLKKGLGLTLKEGKKCKSIVSLVLDSNYSDNKEVYSLTIDKNIEIRAASDAGLFYGVHSFL